MPMTFENVAHGLVTDGIARLTEPPESIMPHERFSRAIRTTKSSIS